MRDGEWVLDYPGTSLTIGLVDSEAFFMSAPDLGDTSILTDDSARPRSDGVAFGVDYRGGRTVTFDLGVNGNGEADARAKSAALADSWRGDSVRSDPGAVATMTTRNAGRERVLYGRPRRFATVDAFTDQGLVQVVADFAAVDDLFYGSTENSEEVGFVPPPSGGFLTPLTSPVSTTPSASSPGAIVVGGDRAAWPVVKVRGPITDPVVSVTGLFDLALLLTIPDGDAVTIDTRPWRRSVTRDSDGASFAGALTRSSRLARASVPPGSYEVALRGVDGTGTSSMRFSWRSTFTSL